MGVLAFNGRHCFLKEWEARHNYPELFYTVTNYLRVCLCFGFLH